MPAGGILIARDLPPTHELVKAYRLIAAARAKLMELRAAVAARRSSGKPREVRSLSGLMFVSEGASSFSERWVELDGARLRLSWFAGSGGVERKLVDGVNLPGAFAAPLLPPIAHA